MSRTLAALPILSLLLAGPALAGDVEFRDSFAVTDTQTGEHTLSTRVENHSGRAEDVYVTRNGRRQKVGRLRPGEKARVTVIPGIGEGVVVFDRHD